jgi:putative chitinase
LDLLAEPQLLEQPVGACRSAAWFWVTQGLNDLADQDAFGSITHRINGGYGGLDSRLRYWLRARRALALS